ncbi:MAG: hypothetical protein K2M78_08080 [Lachnospiraceae bacterium]|nr:hypothetical protein [Lachnospiraceae bacterium]
MVKKRKRNFKKKEDPFEMLNIIMKELDLMEEAVPGFELNMELPVKSGDMDKFTDEFRNTELADEVMVIKYIITMYEEYKKPDEEDIRNVLTARERIKIMCSEKCATLTNIPAGKQYIHYKNIEESLNNALYLNKKAMWTAEKYRRQKECKNINACILNYLKAVQNELTRVIGQGENAIRKIKEE